MSSHVEQYKSLALSLREFGIDCRLQNPEQLTVSSQTGPIWPDRGNTFWLTLATGSWCLFTWGGLGYAIPPHVDVVELCRMLMEIGSSAMYQAPLHIVEQFELRCLGERESEDVFLAMDLPNTGTGE